MNFEVEAFITRGGARIYRIPLYLFPELYGYVHLLITDEIVALVDVGSGFGDSNEQLEAGLQAVRTKYAESVGWSDLTHILITHAHIDHFGGLPYVRERTQAPIGIHELDRRVLTGYEERLATVAGRLNRYLAETGVSAEEREDLMDLYRLGKQLYASMPVEFTFEAAGMQLGPLEFVHVPGHSPGQVLILIDEVMLSGDHILAEISPHVAPERLTLNTGLGHYLDSLKRTRPFAERSRLVLGGHNAPFSDLDGRVGEIWELSSQRLRRVLELADTPRTIAEIAHDLFGHAAGYHRLLALEEAGAYVEYLQQRGYLGVEDLELLERADGTPIRYQSVRDGAYQLPELTAARSQNGARNVRV
ncbi:MAG: MBL fold metallo-hydrolase [Chloroflexota bacterium]